MKKEYKFIAIGAIVILAGAFFLMKDSFLFPWEKGWHNFSYGPEGTKSGVKTKDDVPVSVLDCGYRFVSIQERPDGKKIVWSWKMTFKNLSKKDTAEINIVFKLTDSNEAVLAESNKDYGGKDFFLRPGETETFSGIVESPIYAKQASSYTWRYWRIKH
jgi:uncharacterized protein affecting Mg2+/Co2+ transport